MKTIAKFLLIILDELFIGCFILILLYFLKVDFWIFGLIAVIFSIIILVHAYFFLPHLKKPMTGVEGMIGLKGITIEPLNPEGMVKIRGELWNAESSNTMIDKGEKIVVEKVNDLNLIVKRINKDN